MSTEKPILLGSEKTTFQQWRGNSLNSIPTLTFLSNPLCLSPQTATCEAPAAAPKAALSTAPFPPLYKPCFQLSLATVRLLTQQNSTQGSISIDQIMQIPASIMETGRSNITTRS